MNPTETQTEQQPKKVKHNQIPPAMNERCLMRVLNATFGVSGAQNPQIVLDLEIVKPTSVRIGGVEYQDLDQIKPSPKLYLTLSEKNTDNVLDAVEKLGFDRASFDLENPNTEQFKGIVFSMLVQSKERVQKKPDPEIPGKYVNMTDARGNPVKLGWEMNYQLNNIISRAEDELEEAAPVRPY